MRIQYDDALPISARRDEIRDAFRDHQVVVVAGETGSGKTTQLPKIAYELGARSIAHTQPRRIAARSVARRIADECDVELGREVGYAVRFDDQTSDVTAVRLVTDGLLLAEIHHDRDLRRYDTIIVDEAHERSLAIDFLLGYLKQLLPRRPDLKLVITSATIDVERFAEMFDAPVVEVSGRTYPVEVRYRPPEGDDVLDSLTKALAELPRDGDVLVFLSGEREIRDAADHLTAKRYPHTDVLPLYGRLAAHDQQKIFQDHPGRRRIVLATNVAETSLTVPGIRYVVDAGLARISRYSQRLKVQRLPIEPISQASAAQRAGRCGRLSDGICIRLYSEEDFDGRPEFTEPEILRTNLASVILQMAALDLGDIAAFPFLDAPDSRLVRDGRMLLEELGALSGTRLTGLGRTMSSLPLDPRLGRMMLAADRLGCLADVLVIVSAMSIQDPRERPVEKQAEADLKHARFRQPESDFVSWLSLWTYLREQRDELSHSAFRRMCKAEYLHYLRIREWQDVHAQLRRTARELQMLPSKSVGADPDLVHQALLTGLLGHLGLREGDSREYLGARGARFMIFPGSGVAKKPPQWVMAGELVETSRLWARDVAKIDPAWVEKAAAHLVKRQYAEPHWSARRGAAMARERVTLYGLPIVVDRLVGLGRLDAPLARELFIRHALVQGEWRTHHRFWARNQALLTEVEQVEDRVRARGLKVDDETLFAFYDERIPADVTSVRHFDTWWRAKKKSHPRWLELTEDLLHTEDVEDQFPSTWSSQSTSYDVTYAFEPGSETDGVWVDVPLDQVATLDASEFLWNVPGHRLALVTELIRGLPKGLRRSLVPAQQHAEALLAVMDDTTPDLTAELARQIRLTTGTVVQPEHFDLDALPDHLRVGYRVLEDGQEIARGRDLAVLLERLTPKLRADLERVARRAERTGLTSWDVGALEPSVTVGQATGYPALVDEGTSVALRLLDSEVEQRAASIRGQARLLSYVVATPVPSLGRSLDLRTKLLLSTGPEKDAAAVLDACFLAALDHLVVRHGGPVRTEEDFDALRDKVRQDAHATTEQALMSVVQSLQKLGDVTPSGTEADDVRVQLSWLVYPGWIRETGVEQLRRIPLYLEAAARHLASGPHADLSAVQDLEAAFHAATAQLNPWQRLAPNVQHARWALEELRVSLFAQNLRTAFPVSLPRVEKLLRAL